MPNATGSGKLGLFYARNKDDEQEMLQKQPALQGLPKAKEKEGNHHGRPWNMANFLSGGAV
jgi:hypothetical protein